jgi:hypothetical protein
MFQKALAEVVQLMSSDSFDRFKKSIQFAEYLSDKKERGGAGAELVSPMA